MVPINQINIQFYKTKVAEFILGSFDGKLCLLDFRYRRMRGAIDKRLQKGLGAEFVERDDDILQMARTQIDEYFLGSRQEFELPLLLVGSDFQKSVWNGLMHTPYGSTSSYLDLARQVDQVKAIRPVAAANGANAIAIIIPCHRIIGSNGDLVGYSGGLPLKKRLLKLEQGATAKYSTGDLFG